MQRSRSNAPLFWPLLAAVLALDVITKSLAVTYLRPQTCRTRCSATSSAHARLQPGRGVRPARRRALAWIFIVLTIVALVILGRLYRATAGDRAARLALALVCAGAIGNLLDRLRSRTASWTSSTSARRTRWPTFNVADMAVTTGAMLLAWVLWQEDRQRSLASAHCDPRIAGDDLNVRPRPPAPVLGNGRHGHRARRDHEVLAEARSLRLRPARGHRRLVRFTLAYNPGAAFSMSLGPYSRYIFGARGHRARRALAALPARRPTTTACASRARPRVRGCGRQSDRPLPSPVGVVDFIDIGVGVHRC